MCLKFCKGMMLTTYTKSKVGVDLLKAQFPEEVQAYRKYKKLYDFSSHKKGDKFALLWGEAQLCLPYVC